MDDIFSGDYFLGGENANKVFFFKIAIDIFGHVPALAGDQKLFSFVAFFLDEIVQDGVDDFF
jgi:hypothetical protein